MTRDGRGRVYRLVDGPANVYLVDDGELTLVDGGVPKDAKRIRDGIRALGFAVAEVDRVLLTHYDYDHVGALASLGLSAPVYAGEPDATYLVGAAEPPLVNRKGLLQRALGRSLDHPDLYAYPVADGDRIGGFVAHHTPGHTAGHMAYFHEDSGVAFLGDCVRSKGGTLHPMPSVLCADAEENARSIRKLEERLPTFDVAAPGHGDPITADVSGVLTRLAAES
ncbi:MBL fold metallo-hydrolase [Halalkalicoccus ordinarius]|uniref:MBL fold metallo-hydrolase n=1 Tax=Halalkalicoccus ordinarius TaxID=3116651 RepID=UPI00300F18BA